MVSHAIGATAPPLLEITIGEALRRAAADWGDAKALVSCAEGLRLSWRELGAQASRLAAGLLARGLLPGDRVAAHCYGVPDSKFGEIVVAWILPAANHSPSEADILAHCRGTIAHYNVPARVRFVAELPMTPSGKIKKFIMRGIETGGET